jgi:proteasome lid subunit RPN8/RPN11
LILTPAHWEAILEQARREYPNEACGILAGTNGPDGIGVERVYPMTNVDHSPATYLMDPQEQFRAFKEMRKDGLDLVAIYHSHTASPAYPSRRDRDLAFYPDAVYLIITLQDPASGGAGRAFRIRDQEQIEEIPFHVAG